MRHRRIASVGLSAALVLVTLTLALPSTAFAAVASFRYSHGEPLNNLSVTPGTIFRVGVSTICRSGYSTSVRDVSTSEKSKVYVEYGVTTRASGQYEVDHLISLELGGSNAITNLWPEANDHPAGYLNSKDILENRLHALVCAHQIGLAAAQHLIATNWVTEYHRVFGTWPKALAATGAPTSGSTTPTTQPAKATSPTSTVATTTTSVTTPSGTVTITALIGSVAPGGHESLTAHSSKANDSCTLTVTLPSGRQSTESGLGTLSADASGNATWTWTIGPTTGSGTATASVACGAGHVSQGFTIT